RRLATKRATSSPPSAIGPPAVDLLVPFLAGLAALAAHPEAGHCGGLASKGICPLLDPQIASPSGKTKPRSSDSRFDSANEPSQFLLLRNSPVAPLNSVPYAAGSCSIGTIL